jgi:hypothetical protein
MSTSLRERIHAFVHTVLDGYPAPGWSGAIPAGTGRRCWSTRPAMARPAASA